MLAQSRIEPGFAATTLRWHLSVELASSRFAAGLPSSSRSVRVRQPRRGSADLRLSVPARLVVTRRGSPSSSSDAISVRSAARFVARSV